jgi:hypothetical protein
MSFQLKYLIFKTPIFSVHFTLTKYEKIIPNYFFLDPKRSFLGFAAFGVRPSTVPACELSLAMPAATGAVFI